MPVPVFLGDEVTAAGYRLAGASIRIPEPGRESEALARALASAELVLVAAAVAARIEPGRLRRALAALLPLVVVVPDLSEVPVPDVATRLRAQLGLQP